MFDIAFELVNLLKEKKLTIATAESCTGGFVAKAITDIPGSSDVFPGGVVSYSNDIKESLLGVKDSTLRSYGAVSGECASEMAAGIRKVCSSDIGISTTGIAGPSGGTPLKPVGTVYVGISIKDQMYTKNLCLSPELSRDEIRTETVQILLGYVIDKIKEIY